MTTFFRMFWIIPIAIILGLLSGAGQTINNTVYLDAAGEVVKTTQNTSGGLAAGIAGATALMILFRQGYPRWWFDFDPAVGEIYPRDPGGGASSGRHRAAVRRLDDRVVGQAREHHSRNHDSERDARGCFAIDQGNL